MDRKRKAKGNEETMELREELLVPQRSRRKAGNITIRKVVEDLPAEKEVEALRQEVEVERVPVGRQVEDRLEPWEEEGVLVVPVYEEELAVVRRLILKEELRIHRRDVLDKQRLEGRVRKERIVVEDPNDTGAVRERRHAA